MGMAILCYGPSYLIQAGTRVVLASMSMSSARVIGKALPLP